MRKAVVYCSNGGRGSQEGSVEVVGMGGPTRFGVTGDEENTIAWVGDEGSSDV